MDNVTYTGSANYNGTISITVCKGIKSGRELRVVSLQR